MISIITLLSFSFLMVPTSYAEIDKMEHDPVYKSIQATEHLPWLPENYHYRDWHKRAQKFNKQLFNTSEFDYVFYEPGLYQTAETMLGIVTNVDDLRDMSSSEAITVITALLSDNKLDKLLDPDTLRDLTKKVEAYYHTNNGEHAFLNYYQTPSRNLSFWEQIYPGLLYFMLMDQLEPTENSDELLLQLAESWYDIVMDLGGQSRAVDFAYTGYDFKNKEPYDNGEWLEMDAAAGVALIQYYAFLKFGERKYMQATLWCMNYLNEFEHHPGHRLLYFYLPYLSARLNAQEHTQYNTAKFMEYFFRETEDNNWGWFDGLVGNPRAYGGVASCYESVMAATALVPILKYDQRYAKEVGRYLLHLNQNLEVFIDEEQVVPFNQSQNGNLSIQAGTALGLFASMIKTTNVEGILCVDLNVNEYYDDRQDQQSSFLLFNPHSRSEKVHYQIQSSKKVGLYDLVTQDFLAINVESEFQLEIPPEEAVVLLEIELEEGDNLYKIDRKVEKQVTASMKSGVNITNFKNHQELQDNMPVDLDITLREVGIETLSILIDQEEVFKNVTYEEPYVLNVEELTTGYHLLEVELTDSTGDKDYAYAQFFVNKEETEHIIGEYAVLSEKREGINEVSGSTISPVFELDFSQEPMLQLEITDFVTPWSLYLQDEASGQLFTLVEYGVDKGTVKINVNEAMSRLNQEKFNLYGPHQVRLVFRVNDDKAALSLDSVRWFNKGIHPLSAKQWQTPFTPQKMTQWQSRASGGGKLNYYNGKAYVKNLNKALNGVGDVKTDYFAVDLTKELKFKISVEEVDELWSLLVYLEGESMPHYLQYPTDETGVFTYDVAKRLRDLYKEEDLNELKNIQFQVVTNGDYGAVTKFDYMSLEYGQSWMQLTSIGLLGLISLSAIFVNVNKDE